MSSRKGTKSFSISRLIVAPSLISLVVTLLRLTGELRHWSPRWFSTDTQGIEPSGVSWVIGITWLAVPFGIYFALKLATAERRPTGYWKAIAWSVGGLVVVLACLRLPQLRPPLGFPQILIYIWLAMSIPAALQVFGWPDLFKALLCYGLAARIPVVVVMILAMRGDWGTHYDFVGMPPEFQMSLVPRVLWLAVFPQLVFWVGYTIIAGSVAGSLAAAMFRRRKPSEVARRA